MLNALFLIFSFVLFPAQVRANIPETAKSFQTQLTLVNFSTDEEQKIQEAAALIRRVIATPEFRDGVLGHKWKGQEQFVDNKGYTNSQVYDMILEAAESYLPEKNNVLNAEVELYFEENKTIGYTYPSARRIWMNRKFFAKYTPIQIADNLLHEWMHKLGFDHATTWSEERDHTVPYAIGYLLEKLAKDFSGPQAILSKN